MQCKHYVKKAFTLGTVEADVQKADDAGIAVDHLIFATTAANKSELVLKVRHLSNARKQAGKFTVSIAFWQELSGMLRLNKEVAREYIPGFPGGTLLLTKAAAETTLAIVRSSEERDVDFQADVRGRLTGLTDRMSDLAAAATVHRALAAAMEHGMESLPKKQIGTLRRQMKALLKTPVLESQRITRTPVSRAVRELIFQMERLGLQTK